MRERENVQKNLEASATPEVAFDGVILEALEWNRELGARDILESGDNREAADTLEPATELWVLS